MHFRFVSESFPRDLQELIYSFGNSHVTTTGDIDSLGRRVCRSYIALKENFFDCDGRIALQLSYDLRLFSLYTKRIRESARIEFAHTPDRRNC